MLQITFDTSDLEDVKRARDILEYLLGAKPPLVAVDQQPLEHEIGPIAESPSEPTPEVESAKPQVDLDAAGFPWDERIHSGSRAKNKDGTWKKRRGVSDEEYKSVMDELRNMLQPNGFTSGEMEEQHELTTKPQEPSAAAIFGGTPAPSAAAIFGGTPAPSAAAVFGGTPAAHAAPAGVEWTHVLSAIAKARDSGQITQDQITQVLSNHGVTGPISVLMNRPDLFPVVLQELGLS